MRNRREFLTWGGAAGMALGEAVAPGILKDEMELFNEPYPFTLTQFNGETVTIEGPDHDMSD